MTPNVDNRHRLHVRLHHGQVTAADLRAEQVTDLYTRTGWGGPIFIAVQLLAQLTTETFGDVPARWATFEQLLDDWTGSLGDLLDTAVELAGDSPAVAELPALPRGQRRSDQDALVRAFYRRAIGDEATQMPSVPFALQRAAYRWAVARLDRKLLVALVRFPAELPDDLDAIYRSSTSAPLRAAYLSRAGIDVDTARSLWPDDTTKTVAAARRKVLDLHAHRTDSPVARLLEEAAGDGAAVRVWGERVKSSGQVRRVGDHHVLVGTVQLAIEDILVAERLGGRVVAMPGSRTTPQQRAKVRTLMTAVATDPRLGDDERDLMCQAIALLGRLDERTQTRR